MSKKISRSQARTTQNIGLIAKKQKSRHTYLPISKVVFDPENSRTTSLMFTPEDIPFSKESCKDEAKILQYNDLLSFGNEIIEDGQIQPIVVTPSEDKFLMIAGHRRTISLLIAMVENNYSEDDQVIQAIIRTEKDDAHKVARLQWNENDKRLDLTLGENLKAIRRLVTTNPEYKSETKISSRLVQSIASLGETQAKMYTKLLNSDNKQLLSSIASGEIKSLEKAYFIANLNNDAEASKAIDSLAKGDNLNETKSKIQTVKQDRNVSKQPMKKTKGRPSTSINFGKTKNESTAKYIIDTLLQTPKLRKYKKDFNAALATTNMGDLTEAFKKLIQLLEEQEG